MQRSAWHLTLENHQQLAIAQSQVMEYLFNRDVIAVPDSAAHCNQVLIWRDRVVPVLGAMNKRRFQHEHILVIIYQETQPTTAIRYLALALETPPVAMTVRNQDQCEAESTQIQYWGDSLQSCIEQEHEKIALVDFAHFGQSTSLANAH